MMHRSHQVTANAEEVADESMHGQESLCLPGDTVKLSSLAAFSQLAATAKSFILSL